MSGTPVILFTGPELEVITSALTEYLERQDGFGEDRDPDGASALAKVKGA